MTQTDTTTQPTPGPWSVDQDDAETFMLYRVRPNRETAVIARVNLEADARLIAAAPRMLEALATLTTVIDRGSDGRLDEFDRDLTAALAEARALLRDLHGDQT